MPACLDQALELESRRIAELKRQLMETVGSGKEAASLSEKLDLLYQALQQLSDNHVALLRRHRQFARNVLHHVRQEKMLEHDASRNVFDVV